MNTTERYLTATGRAMTNKKRQLCQAFLLDQPVDAASFWLQLKDSGMVVSRALVYKTLNLLTGYGFADKCHDEQTRLNYFRPR